MHNLSKRRAAFHHLAQRLRHGLDKQIGGGIIAHMQLIAHGKRLRNDHLEVDAAHGVNNVLQGGPQHLFQPYQLIDGILSAAAKADSLAGALVDGGIGIVAVFLIEDADHRHGIGGQAGHRPYGIVVMARFIFYLTAACQCKGFFVIFRQTLVFENGDNGAPHGTAHILPRDRGAGVQQRVLINTEHLMGGLDIDPVGLGILHFIDGSFICLPDQFLQITHG